MSFPGSLSSAEKTSADAKTVVVLIGMAAFFSTNIVIGRSAIDETGPWTLAFSRWAMAALLLLPFAGGALRAAWPSLRTELPRLLTLGLLGMIICGGGVYVSLRYTTATNATLIYTASPAFAVLIESIATRRRPAAAAICGLALATAGIATIVFRGDLAEAAALSFGPGDLGIAAAALSWALYGVILRGGTFGRIPTLASFTGIAIAGAAMLAPFSAVELLTGTAPPSGAKAIASIAALALFPSVAAFSLYQYGVRRVGSAATAMFLYLMPVFGVVFAWALLGEAFRTYHAVGFALVLGGVVLATSRRRLR